LKVEIITDAKLINLINCCQTGTIVNLLIITDSKVFNLEQK